MSKTESQRDTIDDLGNPHAKERDRTLATLGYAVAEYLQPLDSDTGLAFRHDGVPSEFDSGVLLDFTRPLDVLGYVHRSD